MKRHITAGIAGHVDHGKTSLVKRLTGIDTDRLREEKRRGLSIESGIAPIKTDSGAHIALVDVPGHTDFLKNTIRGLSQVDMAILVVAADDGVMPQTLEHLRILQFMKAEGGFVVISKADLVDEETLELAELEIQEALEGSILEGKPILPYSALKLTGLDEIREQLEMAATACSGKETDMPFRLSVDQVKGFSGFGTVVSGTVLSGRVKAGDPLVLLPGERPTRARSLQCHHINSDIARAGQRVGINLHGLSLNQVRRGMVLAQPGVLQESYLLNASLTVLTEADRPLKNRQRIKLYLGTDVINAMLVIMAGEAIGPGETTLVQFRLMTPTAALPRDPFVLGLMNVPTIVAGGTVLEIPKEKFRRSKAETMLPHLKALQENDLKTFLDYFLKNGKSRLIRTDELARNTGFSLSGMDREIKRRIGGGEILQFGKEGIFARHHYEELKQSLCRTVEEILGKNPLKLSLNPQEIKTALLPSLDDQVFRRMLAQLASEGGIIKVKGGFTTQHLSVRLSRDQENLVELCMGHARKSHLIPFSGDTIWKSHGRRHNKGTIQKILNYLHHEKRLVQLNDGRYLLPKSVEEIKARVRKTIEKKGDFVLADLKETLGYGRSVGVPILEHLDTIGLTRREGNRRVFMSDKQKGETV